MRCKIAPGGVTTSTTGGRTTLGPYEILAPLGRGGMGEVYRAWDPRLEREVALKILHERSETHPDRVQRFVAEARAASALNHPNIITVFDAAVDGATPYIVSELIDGEPLREQTRRGAVPIRRLLDLATQITDGLSEAHAAGIVHRDLKPENIMVTRVGRVKILDFGLTQPVGFREAGSLPDMVGEHTLTVPGLAGTIPYMSPEQSRGVATDFRTDQFSLGLILYEMTTGQPAFRRATPAETLEAIISEEPPPLQTLNPQAPLLLSWIVERCLAKHPEDRYASTADLHRDLRRLRDRLAEAVARDGSVPAGPMPASLTRRAVSVGVMLAAIVGGSIAWRLLAEAPPPDLTDVRFTPLATEARYEGQPAWSPDGQTIAYSAEVDGILQIFTRRLNSSAPLRVTNSAVDAKHPFWSPDGRRLYYISLAGTRDGIKSVPAAGPGDAASVVILNASRGAMSPDGRTIAFLRDEDRADVVGTASVWMANTDGTGERRYDSAPFDALRLSDAVVWFSPDGLKLGICATVPGPNALEPSSRGWQFWVLPLPDGEPSRRLQSWSNAAPRVSSFTWIDNRHVVIGIIAGPAAVSELWLADVDEDRRWPLSRGADSYSYPSAAPGWGRVVFAKGDPEFDLVELPLDDRPVRTLRGTSRNEADAMWAPGSDTYAYVTDRAGHDEIWTSSTDSSDDRPLITADDFGDNTIMLSAPSFSPDGRHVAYVRNASRPIWPLRIWYSPVAPGNQGSGGPPVPLLPETHLGYQVAPTWSPDSQWLAFAEWSDMQWKLVKVRIGSTEPPVVLRTDGVANAAPHWSPDGEWITWETDAGFSIVSAKDGRAQRDIGDPGDPRWIVHTWSHDSSAIYGIRETDEFRLALFHVGVGTKQERILRDLGPSVPVNNPFKGLSLDRGGQRLLTSVARLRGDLWLMEGFKPPPGILERLWRNGSQKNP